MLSKMRRRHFAPTLLLVGLLMLALTVVLLNGAVSAGQHKVQICHVTDDATGTGHVIEVSVASCKAHCNNHGDQVIGKSKCAKVAADGTSCQVNPACSPKQCLYDCTSTK
jgi:hypothetical protein